MEELSRSNEKKFKLPVIQLNWYWSVLFILGSAFFVTLTTFYIQPGSLKRVLGLISEQPLILIVNYIPPLIMLVIFYFIFNNVFYSAALTGAIFNIASLINRLKIVMRDDPFVPRDIQLLQEAINTVSDFEVQIDYELVALIMIFAIGFIVLGHIFKNRKQPIKIKLVGILLGIIACFFANKFIYSSNQVYYHKLHVSNRSYVTRVFNELGFTYCFFYNMNTYPVEKPNNFSKEEVENLINQYTVADAEMPTDKPHVFMIMSEAYSDVGLNEQFIFTEETDPYKYWKEITASDHVISGHIVTPGFGGGTANTEFDVLTGMQTNVLNSVPTSAFRVVAKNTQTVSRILQNNGYHPFFMHPGDSWFYNRSSVYRYFGISDQIFSEAFTKEDKKGNMVADSVLTERIIQQFEERKASDETSPIFSYITTIQNHMPYTVRKYGELVIPEIQTTVELSQDAKDVLSVYMEGVRDADLMLKELTEYFEAQDEPVVFVFFGDHLPNLGDNYLAYKELGLDVGNEDSVESIITTYSTPYMIWTNEAAADMLDFENKVANLELPEDNKISANFLGATVLELLGYSGQDPFFDFINEMRRSLPVVYKNYYKTMEGSYAKDLDEYEATILDNFKNWEYYKMKYEKVQSQ